MTSPSPEGIQIENCRIQLSECEDVLKAVLTTLEALQSETRDQIGYCCENPRLRWSDDPDTPGVLCVSCGFVVAENGALCSYPEEELPTKPRDRQQTLFSPELA